MQNSKKPTLRAELRATTINSDIAPHLSRLLRDARSGDIDAFAAAKSVIWGAIGRALHRELSALRDTDSQRAGRIKRLLSAREKEIDLDFIETAEGLAVASDIQQLLPGVTDAECLVRRDLLELAAPLFDAHQGDELDAMGPGAVPFLQGFLETEIRRRAEKIDLLPADTDYLRSMRDAEHARLDALFDAVQRIDAQFVYELLERVCPAPDAWAQLEAEDYAYETEFLRTNLERELTSRCNGIVRHGYSLSTHVYEPDETGEFAFEITLRFGAPSGMTSGYLARSFADVHPLIRDSYDVWGLLDLGEPRQRMRLSDGNAFGDRRDRFSGETRLYSWPQERVLEMLKIPARSAARTHLERDAA